MEKVVALPLTTWNYKSQESSIRHLGPTALDFNAAFGLGESDTGIAIVDADGVALAAIQGLNQNLEATRKELGRRDAENAELKVRFDRLERRLAEKLPGGARWNARSPSHQQRRLPACRIADCQSAPCWPH